MSVPYLRQTASGFYWEPSRKLKAEGFEPRPLGKNAAEAIRMAQALNEEVENFLKTGQKSEGAARWPGTIGWVIGKYLASKKFGKLAATTQRGYRQCLDRIETQFGDNHPEAVTRKVVKTWQAELEDQAPAFAAAILRVLRIVMKEAKNQGHKIDLEDYRELDLHTAGGNEEPWEDWEISAYVDEAHVQRRPEMALALMLGVGLGQREADVLALARARYNAETREMAVLQRKTKKPLLLPVLPELRREIERCPVKGTIFVVSAKTGKSYSEHHFRHVHRAICRAAGIPDNRKFMNLRHTTATRLGDAGCSDQLIQSVTGHKDRQTLSRYVRPTSTQASAAIEALQAHRNRKRAGDN